MGSSVGGFAGSGGSGGGIVGIGGGSDSSGDGGSVTVGNAGNRMIVMKHLQSVAAVTAAVMAEASPSAIPAR